MLFGVFSDRYQRRGLAMKETTKNAFESRFDNNFVDNLIKWLDSKGYLLKHLRTLKHPIDRFLKGQM